MDTNVSTAFLAIGDGFWGSGWTLDEARAARRKVGGTGSPDIWLAVWRPAHDRIGEKPWVDAMGAIMVPGEAIEARKV